ncbi:MAG: hypothetical protein AAB795_01280, partial [Patescibacteria group bacterium]
MSLSEIPRIGLLFTSFVELIVVVSALALVIFFLRRWASLDNAMKAYVIFWLFTCFVWTTSMIRYVLVSFGYENSILEHQLSIVTQIFVFLGGPILFYFVGIRTLQLKSYATCMFAVPSLLLTIWSFALLLNPLGVTTPQINYFSADAVISRKLFYIFGAQILILLSLLAYDVILHFRIWYQNKILIEKYRALNSMALIVYLLLGTIDQSKIFIGWPLGVFRVLYSTSFLFV